MVGSCEGRSVFCYLSLTTGQSVGKHTWVNRFFSLTSGRC